MKQRIRLLPLGIAIGVNGPALMAVNRPMGGGPRGAREAGAGWPTWAESKAPRPAFLFPQPRAPGFTGLGGGRELSGRCNIGFVTPYDQHPFAASEQGAAVYVLKPADAARLAT